jgi:dihydroorotate dehydrogenase
VVLAHHINGVIISNTTISRPESLIGKHAAQIGGLSGRPLFDLSTARLKRFYRITNGKIPLVGVGGISSAHDAYIKIRAGATLVQLYSALVYNGFGIVQDIQRGLAALLARDGFTHVGQAVGADATMR